MKNSVFELCINDNKYEYNIRSETNKNTFIYKILAQILKMLMQ